MTISRRVARPLLSGFFIAEGLESLQHPETKVQETEAVAVPVVQRVSALPQDTVTLVRFNGGLQVAAGALLAIGKFRRLAALALIGSVIPTTVAGHRFWEETDEQERNHQRTEFLRNVALLGGLLLAAVDTEGAPSLGWRAKRQARRTGRAVFEGRGRAARQARKTAMTAALMAQARSGRAATANRAAARATAQAQRALERAQQVDLRKAEKRAAKATQKAYKAAQEGAGRARSALQMGAGHAGEYFQTGVGQAGGFLHTGVGQASELLRTGVGQSGELLQTGAGQASQLLSRASKHLPRGGDAAFRT